MHKPAIPPLVYSRLFPNPKPADPATLQAHITRNLVPEVRSETLRFYGPIDCLESQYPGLDYANPAHRLRLACFPWHRRLFRAFDELRLTDYEIRTLCRWEGTRWARERYEKDEEIVIQDTTWDGIELYVARTPTATATQLRGGEHPDFEPMMVENVDLSDPEDEEMENSDGEIEGEEEQESEDDLQQSVGVELNQRLLAATEARARGEEVVLDAAWEQWLKEAAERDEVPNFAPLTRPGQNRLISPGATQWGQAIPEVFRYGPGTVPPPHIAALRARMPPPPFLPQTRPDTTIDATTSPSHPAGTAM